MFVDDVRTTGIPEFHNGDIVTPFPQEGERRGDRVTYRRAAYDASIGIGMKLSSHLREGGYVPFGPFLALAGLTAMVFGPETILRVVGL